METDYQVTTENAQQQAPTGRWRRDEDIIFLKGINDLSMADGTYRVNQFVALVCYTGKLWADVNMTMRIVEKGQVLVCGRKEIISDVKLSPDFDGVVLSLPSEIVLNLFGESDILDRILRLAYHPVVDMKAGSLDILRVCHEAYSRKKQMQPTTYGSDILCSIVKVAFYELMENIVPYSAPTAQKEACRSKILFKQFLDLLSSGAVRSRTVTGYAEKLCITPKYLSTICRQESGKTAFEWINQYVMIDIRNLLKNTDRPIKELSNMLDFPNASFFGSYCRRHFGMSPMEFRKHLRQSNDTDKQQQTR